MRIAPVVGVACANAAHGKRPTKGDVTRGYDLAVKNGLLDPTDTDAVIKLLLCGVRMAEELTRAAREEKRRARDEAVLAEAAKGTSPRKISKETGVPYGTVREVLSSARKTHSAHSAHPSKAEQPKTSFYDSDYYNPEPDDEPVGETVDVAPTPSVPAQGHRCPGRAAAPLAPAGQEIEPGPMSSNTSQRKMQSLILAATVQEYATWSMHVSCRPCDTTRTIPMSTMPASLTIMQTIMRMRCSACGGQVEAAAIDNQVPGWRARVVRVWGPGSFG